MLRIKSGTLIFSECDSELWDFVFTVAPHVVVVVVESMCPFNFIIYYLGLIMDDVNVQMNLGSNFGSRKFYEIKIPSYSKGDDLQVDKEEAAQKLFNYVEDSCVGKDLVFSGPFGDLPGLYEWII